MTGTAAKIEAKEISMQEFYFDRGKLNVVCL